MKNPRCNDSLIKVFKYGNNISFLLYHDCMYSKGEHKILQNCGIASLVPCLDSRLNGQMQLIYITHGLRSFSNVIEESKEGVFLTIAANVLKGVEEVRENGFLSPMYIYVSPEHIYVDPVTFKAGLIYLPLSGTYDQDEHQFERNLRQCFARQIIDRGYFSQEPCAGILAMLQDNSLTLKDIYNAVKGHGMNAAQNEPETESSEIFCAASGLRLTALDEKSDLNFLVDKDNFIIGRSNELADGVIDGDRSIGRRHVRVTNSGGRYFLEDMGSVNGTYINDKRLPVNVPVCVKNADIVKMADVSFRVSCL